MMTKAQAIDIALQARGLRALATAAGVHPDYFDTMRDAPVTAQVAEAAYRQAALILNHGECPPLLWEFLTEQPGYVADFEIVAPEVLQELIETLALMSTDRTAHLRKWPLRDGRERLHAATEDSRRLDCQSDARKLAETMTEGGQ